MGKVSGGQDRQKCALELFMLLWYNPYIKTAGSDMNKELARFHVATFEVKSGKGGMFFRKAKLDPNGIYIISWKCPRLDLNYQPIKLHVYVYPLCQCATAASLNTLLSAISILIHNQKKNSRGTHLFSTFTKDRKSIIHISLSRP